MTDSAGVRVVTNYAPARGPGDGWMVSATPRLRIPRVTTDTSTELLLGVGATRLSDGTVVVGDRGASAVRYFDSTGTLVRTTGRPGRGPGEYEYLAWLQACGGDSAFVLDASSRSVSVLGADGRVGRTFTIRTPERGHLPFSVRCHRSGGILTSGWGLDQLPPDRPHRPRVPVTLVDREGAVRVVLGKFPGTEMAPEFRGTAPRRLGRLLLLGLGSATAWVAPGEVPDVLGYDRTGRLRAIVRIPVAQHRVTDADVAFHLREALDSSESEARQERVRTQFGATPAPSILPPFLDLVVDADDDVWLRPYPRADDPEPGWLVLGPDGIWLATVATPPGLRIVEIGHDYVLGIGQGPTGAQFVALYTLARADPR